MQAADRFMHMLELHGGPEHLVVFITSDQDFCEKIQELQRRNFKVVVLFHGPSASQKPVSITSVADESHDWLSFLKRELGMDHLTLAPYDPTVYHGAFQGGNSGQTPPPPSAFMRQPSQESRTPGKVIARLFGSTIVYCFLAHTCFCYVLGLLTAQTAAHMQAPFAGLLMLIMTEYNARLHVVIY